MNRSRRFLIRMTLFLVLVSALAVVLGRELVNAFMGNPAVNGVILGILIAGIADRKSTRLNSSHRSLSRMPSSA